MNIQTQSKTLVGKPVSWADLPPKSVILMVQTKGKKASPAAAASSGARMRHVIIDGMLVEMAEEMILALIQSGIFTVVYPGTNIPWDPTEDRHPDYPPDWFPGA
jgi:hypothetical protein